MEGRESVCVCVCKCEIERERKRVCVSVCESVCERVWGECCLEGVRVRGGDRK